jgi:chemotaxis protein CheC
MQLDALRELANISSGTAATALSSMLGREIELSVPRALALPLADAVAATGPEEQPVTGVAIMIEGDVTGVVLLLFAPADADVLCGLLGVEAGSEVGQSALCEIGNILGTSYINALAAITGLDIMPSPPHLAADLLGALVSSVLAQTVGDTDTALLMDSELDISGAPCSLSFLLLPTSGGVEDLLRPLGLGSSK